MNSVISIIDAPFVPKIVSVRENVNSLYLQLKQVYIHRDTPQLCVEPLATILKQWNGRTLFLTRHDITRIHKLLDAVQRLASYPLPYFLHALEYILFKASLPLAPPEIVVYIEISRHRKYRIADALLDELEVDAEFLALISAKSLESLYAAGNNIGRGRLLSILEQVPELLDSELALKFLLTAIVDKPGIEDVQLFSFCLQHLHKELNTPAEDFMEALWKRLAKLPFEIDGNEGGDWIRLGAFNVYFRRIFAHDPQLLHISHYERIPNLAINRQVATVASLLRLLHLFIDNYESGYEGLLMAQIRGFGQAYIAKMVQVADYFLSLICYNYGDEHSLGLRAAYRVLLTALSSLTDGLERVEEYLVRRNYLYLLQFWLAQHPEAAWPLAIKPARMDMAAFAILLRHFGKDPRNYQSDYITQSESLRIIAHNYRLVSGDESAGEAVSFDRETDSTYSASSDDHDEYESTSVVVISQNAILHYDSPRLIELLRALAYVVLNIPFCASLISLDGFADDEVPSIRELTYYLQHWADKYFEGQPVRVRVTLE